MSKITKQNVGGTDYTMVGCALTGVCASAADAFIKAVTLSDGDEISDGMTVIVTFANGNTAGTAPASKTIYSSDQVNYYEDTGLTVPFTLAPAGCYEITYTGTGNAYTYISYPVIQIGNITGVICDAGGNTVSGSLWAKGAQVGIMFKDGKFLLVSGALLNNLSALPTDAVLHYSFDDLPDYPDGTADVRLLNNNTYNIQSTSQMFNNNGGATFSNVNGNLQIVAVGDSAGVYITNASIENKILKFKIKVTSLVGVLRIRNGILNVIEMITSVGEYVICYLHKNDAETNKGLYILCGSAGADSSCTFTVEQIYIGDGSYATPIIDNANGQNNATNNGGLAVKGVSGKGAYFLNKKYARIGNYNLSNDFTISVWVKPANDTTGLVGAIVEKTYHIGIRNGELWNNNLLIFIYPNGVEAAITVNGLLPANEWTHLVLTKSGTTLKIYKNSEVVNTTTLSSNIINQNNNNFDICSSRNSRPQTIDDLLIFDRALSEAEVTALYLNRANTPKFYDLNNYELQDIQPSFGCPRGGTYTLNRLTKQSIGKLNIYAGSVTFGADASGGNMYLNIDGLINTNADACFSQWTIKDVNSGYLDLSASTPIWVRIGIASDTYLQTADCAGKTMDFILITMPK